VRVNFFLIVSAGRFIENDAWVDNEIQKQDKQFFVIRNKINIDLENEKCDHPKLNSTGHKVDEQDSSL